MLLVVCFLYKTNPNPRKKYFAVAQIPLLTYFFVGWVGLGLRRVRRFHTLVTTIFTMFSNPTEFGIYRKHAVIRILFGSCTAYVRTQAVRHPFFCEWTVSSTRHLSFVLARTDHCLARPPRRASRTHPQLPGVLWCSDARHGHPTEHDPVHAGDCGGDLLGGCRA